MIKGFHIFLIFVTTVLLISCSKKEDIIPYNEAPFILNVPAGFPNPIIPNDNTLNKYRVDLGRKLFYDPILSRDSSISCATCHLQEKAFTDGKILSNGVQGGITERNTPNITNIAYHNAFFWDGGNHSLELQVIGPIESVNEMNLTIPEAIERLKEHNTYPNLFKLAYGLNEPNIYGLTRALASFERTLISGNSPYDKYTSQGQSNALTSNELNGKNLFFSATLKCAECHTGFNFTSLAYENNGIYLNYADDGRGRVTLNTADNGKFKVPSLRNIEVTGPYMHDGSFNTLEDVIDHYAQGGKGNVNQSPKIGGFTITNQEKQDLIAFLKSLTDQEFLENPNFKSPY